MANAQPLRELLEAGLDDWVSLHDAVHIGSQGQPSDAAKATVLSLLGQVYRDGLLVPGELGDSGFEDWPGEPDDWLVRSRQVLDNLGWRPMGAGFWLRLTDRGQERLKA